MSWLEQFLQQPVIDIDSDNTDIFQSDEFETGDKENFVEDTNSDVAALLLEDRCQWLTAALEAEAELRKLNENKAKDFDHADSEIKKSRKIVRCTRVL